MDGIGGFVNILRFSDGSSLFSRLDMLVAGYERQFNDSLLYWRMTRIHSDSYR